MSTDPPDHPGSRPSSIRARFRSWRIDTPIQARSGSSARSALRSVSADTTPTPSSSKSAGGRPSGPSRRWRPTPGGGRRDHSACPRCCCTSVTGTAIRSSTTELYRRWVWQITRTLFPSGMPTLPPAAIADETGSACAPSTVRYGS